MMESNDRGSFDDGGREYRAGRGGRTSAEGGRSGPSVALIALILVVIAIVVFVFRNDQDVPVDFLFDEYQNPLWVVIAISILLGVVLSRLAGFIWRRARRRDD